MEPFALNFWVGGLRLDTCEWDTERPLRMRASPVPPGGYNMEILSPDVPELLSYKVVYGWERRLCGSGIHCSVSSRGRSGFCLSFSWLDFAALEPYSCGPGGKPSTVASWLDKITPPQFTKTKACRTWHAFCLKITCSTSG